MKRFAGAAAFSAALLFVCAGAGYAADSDVMVTKAPVAKAPAAPATAPAIGTSSPRHGR